MEVTNVKSLEELRELRDKAKKDMQSRDSEGKPQVIIGMGTCGIAAGAREVMQAIMDEIDKRDVEATITQTGCIGMCEQEPLVDIKLPGEERITYGDVTPDKARKIVVSHLINGNILDELVVGRLED
jgi:NADP-reducing hydrogenase subunit HndB